MVPQSKETGGQCPLKQKKQLNKSEKSDLNFDGNMTIFSVVVGILYSSITLISTYASVKPPKSIQGRWFALIISITVVPFPLDFGANEEPRIALSFTLV